MSSHLRRGINVSVFLQDLNAIPSADEQPIDSFDPEDLDIWTGARFFDYDMGGLVARDPADASEQKPTAIAPTPTTTTTTTTAAATATAATPTSSAPSPAIDPSLDEPVGGFDSFLNEFENFENFDEYSPTTTFGGFSAATQQQHLNVPPAQQAILPAVTPKGGIVIPATPAYADPATAVASPTSSAAAAAAKRGTKRKASVSSPDGASQFDSLEDASRLAAEEDKRRRNTAASARFRVKKKQKEQQLENTAKEMTDRVHQLEQRVQQLELENKWLKGLIVEKNGGKSGEEMLMPPSLLSGGKDGVGTVPKTE